MTERGTAVPPLVLLVGDAAVDHCRVERLLDSGAVVVLAASPDTMRSWLPQAPLDHDGAHGTVRIDGLEISLAEQRASWRGQTLHLTRLELKVLATLAQNLGRAWSFADLQERAWSSPYFGDASHVRAAVKRLRRKLDRAQVRIRIESVRGVGFRLVNLKE
jgi:DNA-binding response OmpR family regulator